MADLRIALGAEFDVASGKELSDGFDGLHRAVRGIGKRVKPIYRPLVKSTDASMVIPATAGQTLVLNVGRPQSGRIWNITRVCVLGEDDNTTHTNMVAALYIGDSANVALGQCVKSGISIPWTTTENEKAYIVHDREDLFVKFTAINATVVPSMTVTVTAWEYPDDVFDAQAI